MARNNRELFGNFLSDISQAFGNYWQFQHEEQRYQTGLASDEANLWANRAWDTYAPESDIDAQVESYMESYPKADEDTIRRRLELGMRPTTERISATEEFLKENPFYAGEDADLWKKFGFPGDYDPSEIATGVPEHLKAPDLFSIEGSKGKDIPTEDYPLGYTCLKGTRAGSLQEYEIGLLKQESTPLTRLHGCKGSSPWQRISHRPLSILILEVNLFLILLSLTQTTLMDLPTRC